MRELIEWCTFSEKSTICHLFLNNVKCDEPKKLCFKILRKNPDGDTKKLIAELQTLKNLQNVDNQGGKVKPVFQKPAFQRTACPKCNIKGHLEKDCWGQCKVCEGWGHQMKYCRRRPELEDSKAKAAHEKRVAKKLEKKRRKKKAKKAQEANDLLTTFYVVI